MKAALIKYLRPVQSGPCCLAVLALSALWPVGANQSSELRPSSVRPRPAPPRQLESTALQHWSRRLRRHRYDLDKQGILVESLDGRTILAQLNPATPLNPASVMKLATTLVALARLGPDYRFVTRVYGDSPIDRKNECCPAISIWSATGIPFSAGRTYTVWLVPCAEGACVE